MSAETKVIDNTQDVLDSRDIIARIEELEGIDAAERSEDEISELATLATLAEEGKGSPDWHHGETLIRESYFTTYIEELIDDCYPMPKELNSGDWPWRHVTVDYDAAADEAKADYNEIDFDGVTYLIRA